MVPHPLFVIGCCRRLMTQVCLVQGSTTSLPEPEPIRGEWRFFLFGFLAFFFSEKSGIVIVGSQRKSLVTPTTRVICRIYHIRKSDIHWVWPPRMRIPRDHQDDAFLGLRIPKLVVWVDVSPFPSEYFQVPAVVFGGAIHESIVFSRFFQVITLVLPHIEKRCTKHRLKLDLKTSLSQKTSDC